MICITTQQEQGGIVIIIDGQIQAADLPEIKRVRMAQAGAVALQLGGVTSCTADGVQLLREWLDAGAQLRDATLFLRMILEDTRPSVSARIPDNEALTDVDHLHVGKK